MKIKSDELWRGGGSLYQRGQQGQWLEILTVRATEGLLEQEIVIK